MRRAFYLNSCDARRAGIGSSTSREPVGGVGVGGVKRFKKMDGWMMDALLLLSGSIASWLRCWRKLRMRGIKRTKLCRKTQLWGRRSTRCAGTSRCVLGIRRRLSSEISFYISLLYSDVSAAKHQPACIKLTLERSDDLNNKTENLQRAETVIKEASLGSGRDIYIYIYISSKRIFGGMFLFRGSFTRLQGNKVWSCASKLLTSVSVRSEDGPGEPAPAACETRDENNIHDYLYSIMYILYIIEIITKPLWQSYRLQA